MGIWKAGAVIGVVSLAMAACSQANQRNDAINSSTPTTVEVPNRRAGLWKQTMLVEGIDVIQTAKLCLDGQSDSKLAWWGQQGFKQACRKNDILRRPDGSWTFSSVCEGAGVKTTNDGTAVGDFGSRYQLKAETTTTGAPLPEMNGSRTITIDAEWLGECPDGMRAGDVDMPNGQRVNMLEVSGQQ